MKSVPELWTFFSHSAVTACRRLLLVGPPAIDKPHQIQEPATSSSDKRIHFHSQTS